MSCTKYIHNPAVCVRSVKVCNDRSPVASRYNGFSVGDHHVTSLPSHKPRSEPCFCNRVCSETNNKTARGLSVCKFVKSKLYIATLSVSLLYNHF